ncbi:hypothetical protein [Aneurinibacillus aneurinilyticus]|uniref:Uncharacterized protein n=1 Tax=Aneurinibacillus aneurinilyticus ATCC 12856 TaxID=649747 RepID=U1X498_ANEAE|nr:hypothetical protein [Aneurinibacillus aneurinilyticus]ERI09358.1 hypothetical protein HMPREF0083_02637 [Aneurinibacillus aneurinilyticus ATCC 12856]MED0672173.1 hypothetical protein [Aneurinibacillus aneurinilyticus]MED0704718.1 hypothetical protein [Aneurinibacillus aneurinilyticus]MED0723964.1 hypothetical protein [Aneurinibacillus aneurinilyticus]MED0731973.1 hypothetical protein [Aneurinibacillus aneurinilyticus]
MLYYDDKSQVKKWERLSLLRAKVRYMENQWPETDIQEERPTVLEEMRNGETVNINAIHIGVSWQQTHDVNREIFRRIGMDAYRDTYR